MPSPVPTATQSSGPPVDRVAYVGLDNHVYTVAPDGTGRRQITPPEAGVSAAVPAYTWPTWSPDARFVLLSGAVPDPGFPGGRLAVYVADEASPEGNLRAIHQDRSGSEGILPGVYHYGMWSPDGRQVAIIAVGLDDLALFVSGVDGSPARQLIAGSPLYVTWSWDSARVYVHQQNRLMMFDTVGGLPARSLGSSGRYQAPAAASSPGGRVAYVVDGLDGESDIVVTEADGTNRRDIAMVPSLAAVQWSPDGRRLAIGRTEAGDARNYGELLIADPITGETRTVLDGPLFSFEWSPDGRRILIARHDPENAGLLRWSILDAGNGSIRHVVDLRPTPEFGIRLVYFDQYAQSHRLWAPDGRHFVLAGDVPGEGAAAGHAERVWVVDGDGVAPPVPVADGYLAFWSPR